MRASENPFSVQRIHSLPFKFDGAETLANLQQRFWNQVACGQRRQVILGHHGVGKSTLLRELGAYWQAAGCGVVWLNGADLRLGSYRPWSRKRRTDGRQQVVLVDSAERLSWWDWFRIWVRFRGTPVLQTAHSAGRLPVLYQCGSTYQLFEQLCVELLGDQWHRFDAACPLSVRRELFETQGGDLRQCFFELFDRMAQGTGPFGRSTRIIVAPGPQVVDVSDA